MKEYLENKNLIDVAKRSPELIFDNYQDIKDYPQAKEAYRIASQEIKRKEK